MELCDAETETKTTSDPNSEKTKLYKLSQSINRPSDAREISSQSEEMKQRVLAMLVRKMKLALIPIVGIRVAEKH